MACFFSSGYPISLLIIDLRSEIHRRLFFEHMPPALPLPPICPTTIKRFPSDPEIDQGEKDIPTRPVDVRTRPRPHSTGSSLIAHRMTIRGFSKTTDGVHMYNVDVEGPEGPMSAYTIRRRFSDFKRLHLSISPSGRLPNLPEYGVAWRLKTYISDESIFEQRISKLQNILDSVVKNPKLVSHSAVFDFIGKAPCSQGTGYVSLAAYGAPCLELHDEKMRYAQLRKRATSEPNMLGSASA